MCDTSTKIHLLQQKIKVCTVISHIWIIYRLSGKVLFVDHRIYLGLFLSSKAQVHHFQIPCDPDGGRGLCRGHKIPLAFWPFLFLQRSWIFLMDLDITELIDMMRYVFFFSFGKQVNKHWFWTVIMILLQYIINVYNNKMVIFPIFQATVYQMVIGQY